ncbi:hypothetical protein QTP88_008815 [Uroleucon formosanum]
MAPMHRYIAKAKQLVARTKCESCKIYLKNINTSLTVTAAELVNVKSRGYLTHPNTNLFILLKALEISFEKFADSLTVFEDTYYEDYFSKNVNINFPCVEHQTDTITDIWRIPDIDFPYKIYEDGKSFRFSTFFYTMKLKSGINVPRFWLCYSVGWNVAYCETCWLFANHQYAYYQDSWVNGINDWRHLSSKIEKHESSVQHIYARKNRSNWEKNLTIDKIVEHQYTIEINYWRNVLKRIIKIILSLTAGNTALRSHEHKDNQGKLSSPVIWYVILDYETRNLTIEESFLGFFCIQEHGAKNYEQLITNVILELGLDINMCRGQGYDGAAVMKGFYSGLQKRIKDKVPTASYIHCCAHNLNLVISDAVKSNQKVQFFFDTVQAVFNFFSSSAPRWATLAFGKGNANAKIATTTTNPFFSSGPVDWKLFQAKLGESLSLNTPLKYHLKIDLAISKLTKTIQNAVSHSSLTTSKKNQSKSHTSLPSYLVNLIKAKRRDRSLWQRSKYPEHKTAYNHLSNDLKSQLAKYRSEQFSLYLSTVSPYNSSLWKMTKKLTNQCENIPPLERPDKSLAIIDLEKVNLFGAHLFSTFSPYLEVISMPDHTDLVNSFLSSPLPMSLLAKPIYPSEIVTVIQKLRPNKAPGHDQITNKVAKNLSKKSIMFLTHIYNSMLRLSYFPSTWKHSVIIMISKPNKSKHLTSSYRPISLLPTFAKLFEKLILHRISSLIDQ